LQVFLFLHAEARKKCQASASTKPDKKNSSFTNTDAADFRQTLHPQRHCTAVILFYVFLLRLLLQRSCIRCVSVLFHARRVLCSLLLLHLHVFVHIVLQCPHCSLVLELQGELARVLQVSFSSAVKSVLEKEKKILLDHTYLHQCFFSPVFFFEI
jgi:hypothetical protein